MICVLVLFTYEYMQTQPVIAIDPSGSQGFSQVTQGLFCAPAARFCASVEGFCAQKPSTLAQKGSFASQVRWRSTFWEALIWWLRNVLETLLTLYSECYLMLRSSTHGTRWLNR